ncbi:hypothetical protein HRbin08_01709 [bacterium HR08]|nr:hypothetical protein HRbin08_01709 [bacterium HR08]
MGTYIYCHRFSEVKSVLICALRCPYALGCRDWAGALASDRRERIEREVRAYAEVKGLVLNPEVWPPLSGRRKGRRSSPRAVNTGSLSSSSPSGTKRASSRSRIEDSRSGEGGRMGGEKSADVKRTESLATAREVEAQSAKRKKGVRTSSRRKRREAQPARTIFLILDRNGRYREVKSEEEMKRIAIESAGRNKKGLRFARATLLEVEVTFRPIR